MRQERRSFVLGPVTSYGPEGRLEAAAKLGLKYGHFLLGLAVEWRGGRWWQVLFLYELTGLCGSCHTKVTDLGSGCYGFCRTSRSGS